MAKKVGTRIRIDLDSSKALESEDGADVVVDQVTREFTAVLQLTREKQCKELTAESFGGAKDDVVSARQEVAFYGDITQKLVPLVDRLMRSTPGQINTQKKTELFLVFGDKFYQAQEFRAASTFFYQKVLVLDEETNRDTPQNVLERTLASKDSPPRKRSRLEGQAYVRALFGIAMCCFHAQKSSDVFVRNPGKLEKMIEALTLLRLGMEISVAMERQYAGQFSWLTLNGSVLIYSIAKPLQALGFSKEVVNYLKWSLLAMESTVTLCTTKYIIWRLQLGSAICECYEDLTLKEQTKADQHAKSAVACAAYLQQLVQRLRKEEELDMPLPPEVQRILLQAETTTAMLASRVKAAEAHQPLTKISIEAAFPAVRDQIRATVDAMETLSREAKLKQGGQALFALIPTDSPMNESLLGLFDFVMIIVSPMLKSLVEDEQTSSTLDPAIFPVSFHLIAIRHCFQLAKPDEQMILLTRSAHARLQAMSDGLTVTDTAMVKCLLELYEALHEVQQSWLTWEALSKEERLQSNSNPRMYLPMSGGTIPALKFLTRLSKAMQACVFHGDSALARTNQDLLTSVALQMWREFGIPMLQELDISKPSQFSKPLVRLTCELLLTIHFTLTAVKFEDLLLHAEICLRLATLLSIRGKARTGSQVVRQCLDRIDSRRSELVNFSSHFHSVVSIESTTPLSNASFSCATGDLSLTDDSIEATNARDLVGVPGTGSQLGGLNQDLCCIQVDLLLSLYRLELQDATMIETLPLTNTKASTITPGTSFQTSTVLLTTEAKLVEECHQNGYTKALLNIQRLAHPNKSTKERRALADECLQLLQQMERQEENLRRHLISTSSSTESSVPAAPIVISRSSSAITVRVVEYQPSIPTLRKKRVQYYMVFAKPVGAGTAVSLNSNQLAGTATPLYPPHLNATISGLLPNASYVFAVAAFDSKHEVIQSIGETSEPVVALNPLPLAMCYGYLAKACYDAQLTGRANQAAKYLYNAVASVRAGRPAWMANPFYRQALKRDAVAQLPIPVLNLCIQALLILCHDEPGDLDQDGKLITSSDLDAQSLTATQTKALEDNRKISMGIEIACATDNQEAVRVLCFKGYRLLLPLLHLKGSCDGLTLAALVTYYQALHVIPHDRWDVDTRSICARIGFELFRITQEAHGDISRVTLPLVLARHSHHEPEQTPSDSTQNEEDDSLQEVVALFKLATSAAGMPPSEMPATAMVSPRGAGAKTAAAISKDKSQNNTPQATPRTGENDKAEAGKQNLNDILQATGNDLSKVFITLEQLSASDRRAIEFASKICGAILGAGGHGIAHIDKFLLSLKVNGAISSQFRDTLSSLGGDSLLPALKEDPPVEENPLSSREDQEATTSEAIPPESTIPKTGADDDYLYRWCGELFFIQSVLLYRKIATLSDTINEVDTTKGPDTENCTYELLHGGHHNENDAGHTKKNQDSEAPSVSDDSPTEVELETTNADASQVAQLDQLFGELLEKSAGCCKLFQLAHCWQGLQAVAQQLWNAIWLAWVPPTRISASPTRLTHLSTCIDALLDMMDSTMNATPATALPTSTVFSTVAYAAANALNVDHTWLARLMAYSLRAFCSFQDWKSVVQKGSRYHSLCSTEGSRFSEQNFPILLYAQQQILDHQEALLTAVEEELKAFITAFQEQEAKKKKKKSRLVVEEVLSPEQMTFRAKKQEMEQRIQKLTTERNLERKTLVSLSEIYDGLSKAINKSHQALKTCHELVEKYRRHDQLDGSQEELSALRRQIISSFNRCVVLARQKRQKRIVCQALHEVGDFHLASGDLKAAIKSWLESLDNAFNTLNVCSSWREVLVPDADHFLENSTKDTIAGDELWVCMQCCNVLSKLVMHSSGVNLQKAIDYALMAAAIFTRFYGCSLPHPTKCFLYGSYRMLGQLWPGRELLNDPDRISPFSLGIMLMLVPEVLLQYDQYASTAMPVIAGYEYVAESCLKDANHVANAQRLRVEALVQCGRFQEAFQVLMNLLRGGTTPRDSTGAPDVEAVVFHDNKSLLDEINRAAINWLISLNVEQIQAGLNKRYHETLVVHILAVILHLAVAMARHESRYDRDTVILRPVAKKMAQTLLSSVKPRDITSTQTSRNAEGAASSQTIESISWEDLQLRRIRADVHLQLSYLAFFEGDWNASKISSMDAIGEYDAIPLGSERPLRLALQKLKFSLLYSRGTYLAKCRSQIVACCLAQTHYRTALETTQMAIEETRVTGEEHFRQQLEMQRLQAMVFLGEREKAEQELFALREDALATHTATSLTYVRTLQNFSSLLRSKALLSSFPAILKAVDERLSEAQQVLDALLEHDGWLGVSSDHSSPLEVDKRLNLYRSAIPDFVKLHAELAQVLLECPLKESENVHERQKRALRCVEVGIRSLDHTTQRMPPTKARLLLLKGVLLSKSLHSTTTQIEVTSSMAPSITLDDEKLKQRLEESVEAFVGCIKASIEGGYDRQLARFALIELVDLFGRKLVPGDEDAHVQAAFHYLTLALEVQKHESVLFDTLELQNGTVTSVDKLPASVCTSINAQSNASEDGPPNTKAPDVGAIVNYFVRLLRMQHILPVCTAELQDTCSLLHSFLMQYHSTYARLACLTDLPAVPTTDPEIRAGLVCALWGQNLAPAIVPVSGDSTHNTKLTLYFAIGTTKVSIADDSPAAGNDAAIVRMEKFASFPLLSKRCNLDRRSVQHLKAALSSLRTQMEDEDSLLIDRNAFQQTFHLTLSKIQQLFRGAEPSVKDEARDSTGVLHDAIGDAIIIECTLETVRRLEDLFSINKGVHVADNDLCYFLRDLLD
ncbi:hypothetical protein F443_06127 [Phytophthora nicotianae P1569]|uniref:Fibronectin type-III domain-containing protein n=1 Tax=Phytophthora nicotianae P1569 TaxID=1317065 RepID=V9FHJ2_PHYNI|nr:hypothetical protein F443_06127 [Phytophthora nicotianae P1569]